MNISSKNINWYLLVFIIFTAGYAILMLISPNLAPTDDYIFLHTLQIGRPLLYNTAPAPGYDTLAKTGRWPSILGDMEYNLTNFFSNSPSAFWYFLIHALQYLILMFVFVKILNRFTANKILIYITPVLFSLTFFSLAFFRTHMAEKNLLFFYAIFLFFYLNYLEKPKLYYLIFGVISANMAIQNKEIGFVALAAFAFCHLFLSWKKSQPKADEPRAQRLGVNPVRSNPPKADADTFSHRTSNGVKIFDSLVLFGSFIFLFLYYLVVYRHLAPNAILYSHTSFNSLLVFIKNFLNYSLFTDPILILILLPFTAWRIYKFLRRQLELHPVYDSMLIAGSIFVIAYFALNMYSPSYLLPAYIFALPALIYFFSQAAQRTIYWKGIAIVCGLVLIFNVFPTGIHYITYHKYLSVNFNKTLGFLVSDINAKYSDSQKRANIFIDAVDPNAEATVCFVFTEFLQYKGLTWNKFDFKSNIKTEDNIPRSDFLSRQPFTIFKTNNFSEISEGDYLIITPDSTTKNITQSYIQSLNEDYNLVFKTYSPLAFPNLNLKTLAKYFLSKILSKNQKMGGVIINENLIQSPDYYVFIKR